MQLHLLDWLFDHEGPHEDLAGEYWRNANWALRDGMTLELDECAAALRALTEQGLIDEQPVIGQRAPQGHPLVEEQRSQLDLLFGRAPDNLLRVSPTPAGRRRVAVQLTAAGRRRVSHVRRRRSAAAERVTACREALLDFYAGQPPVTGLGSFQADPRSFFWGEPFDFFEEICPAFEFLMDQGLIAREPPVPGRDMVLGTITAAGRSRVRRTASPNAAAGRGGRPDRARPVTPVTGSVWLGPFPDHGTPAAVYRDGLVWLGARDQGSANASYRNGAIWLDAVDHGGSDATFRRDRPGQPGGGIWHPAFVAHTGALPNATVRRGCIWKGPLGPTVGALPDATYRGDDYGAAAAAVALDLVDPSIRDPRPLELPD